jgi:hypothetical protein
VNRVDQILAEKRKLEEDLKIAMEEERDVVLKDIKAKIKMFDFKATDFKGMFKTRITKKQVDEFLERKKAEVTKPKTVKKGVSKS